MYRNIQSGHYKDVARKLVEIIKARQDNYGNAIFKLVQVKRGDKLYPFWVKVELLHKDDDGQAPLRLEYDEAILSRHIVSIDELCCFLIAISEGRAVETPDNKQLQLLEGNADLIMLGTLTNYGHVAHPWPCYFGEFRLPTLDFAPPTLALAKRGLPVFPNIQTATRDFLGLEARPDQYTTDLRMIIAAPDFRAKITGVTISSRKIGLAIDCRALRPTDITAKIYASNDRLSYQSPDIIFDDSKTIMCEPTFEPETINAYVLDSKDEIMDAREINLKSSYYTSDVTMETPSLQVIEMVKRGERDDVEFKAKVGDEFLESLVSFANTDGGIILLGVDDHCKIVGTDEDVEKLRDRLTARIARNVEPPTMKFELEKIELDDEKYVILIRVFKREKRALYSLHDRGILVRRGSSDRWITSAEVEELYSRHISRPFGFESLPGF